MRNPHSYGYQSWNDWKIHQTSETEEGERLRCRHCVYHLIGSHETYCTTHFDYNKPYLLWSILKRVYDSDVDSVTQSVYIQKTHWLETKFDRSIKSKGKRMKEAENSSISNYVLLYWLECATFKFQNKTKFEIRNLSCIRNH